MITDYTYRRPVRRWGLTWTPRRCYACAVEAMFKFERAIPPPVLVHGTIEDEVGYRFRHAWVELKRDGIYRVLDGFAACMVEGDAMPTRAEWRREMKAIAEARYDQETMRLIVGSGKIRLHGSWHVDHPAVVQWARRELAAK